MSSKLVGFQVEVKRHRLKLFRLAVKVLDIVFVLLSEKLTPFRVRELCGTNGYSIPTKIAEQPVEVALVFVVA